MTSRSTTSNYKADDPLIIKIAKTCNRILHGLMSSPQDVQNEGLIIYHDALLAMSIANLSPERRQAVITSVVENSGHVAVGYAVPEEGEGTGASTREDDGLSPQMRKLVEGGQVIDPVEFGICLRLMDLPDEAQHAVVDVVKMINDGSIEEFLSG